MSLQLHRLLLQPAFGRFQLRLQALIGAHHIADHIDHQLGQQSVGRILELGPGMLLHFKKPCDEPLSLSVGNCEIAVGDPVKVGDKFGLRITSMVLPEEKFEGFEDKYYTGRRPNGFYIPRYRNIGKDKRDYLRVPATVRDALARFATGCYAIWYPQVQRPEPAELARRLERIPGTRWLHATLTVRAPSPDGLGLHGSGMFVVNPPWTLSAALDASLPWLAKVLAQDAAAGFTLRGGEPTQSTARPR